MKMKRGQIATAALALLLTATAAWAAMLKFEFTTTIDDTEVTIRASTKETGNGSQFTTCGYFDENGQFLGQYEQAGFFSVDGGVVQSFCEAHFSERQ